MTTRMAWRSKQWTAFSRVVVVSTGSSRRNAPWGELLSTAAVARGARGAIVDGLVRDVRRIQEMRFPLFAAGFKPVDSKGRARVTAYGVPVECGGVLVRPGDLIFADLDGVGARPELPRGWQHRKHPLPIPGRQRRRADGPERLVHIHPPQSVEEAGHAGRGTG